jgi:hypothetical protein
MNELSRTASVALKKPSLQSSFYQLKGVQFTADRAVDGKRNTDGLAAPYLASTNGILNLDIILDDHSD